MSNPEAAVALLHARLPAESVLLIRRTERAGDAWSGHWSLPGGRRDPEDSDLLHTALRELFEECGITLPRSSMEAELPPVLARRSVGRYLLVAPFQFGVAAELPTELNPDEAAGSHWVPLSVLRDPSQHVLSSVPWRPPEMRYPAIDLFGVPLWGFTYRLLTEWLRLVPRAEAATEASANFAARMLSNLLAAGLTLEQDWHCRHALVRGQIPVDELWQCTAGSFDVNMVEIRPDYIHIAGLNYEEYLIDTIA